MLFTDKISIFVHVFLTFPNACNGTTAAIFWRRIIILNLYFHTENDKLIFKYDYEDTEQQQKGNLGYGGVYGFYQQQLQQGVQPDNQSQLVTGIMQPLAHVMGMEAAGGTSISGQQQQHEGFNQSYLCMFLF